MENVLEINGQIRDSHMLNCTTFHGVLLKQTGCRRLGARLAPRWNFILVCTLGNRVDPTRIPFPLKLQG